MRRPATLTLGVIVLMVIAVAGYFYQARAEGGEEGGSGVVALGWAAIGSGAIGTGSLVAYKLSRKALIATVGSGGITRSLTVAYKPALNFHIAMNLIGYAAGMTHGMMLSQSADGISIALVLVMTVMVASGVLMRFSPSRVRLFNIQLHGQVFLVMLLVVLVLLHTITAGEYED